MENLKYLLSTYFHQDWDYSHTTWQEVVDEFLTDDQTTVKAVPAEIDQLLSLGGDESALAERMAALGCDYAPPEGDRAWLAAVRDRIRAVDGP